MITTVLLDLDGVVRHFDPEHVASVEAEHGLPAGTLTSTAFAPELLEPTITGKVTRAEWIVSVGVAVDNPAAAEDWLVSSRGRVDPEMVAEVDDLRAKGFVVAILTNGTSTIDDEMVELGLTERFDAIFNTADIGFAKPDRRAFEHVCQALDVEPTAVFFTDDSVSKLAGAEELGMTARHFTDIEKFRADLQAAGVI